MGSGRDMASIASMDSHTGQVKGCAAAREGMRRWA
jgi:hypothetical protein